MIIFNIALVIFAIVSVGLILHKLAKNHKTDAQWEEIKRENTKAAANDEQLRNN
jgi:hypothetical protein